MADSWSFCTGPAMAHTNFCLLELKIVMQMELVGAVPHSLALHRPRH